MQIDSFDCSFLHDIDRINQPDYLPTQQDIHRLNVTTNGIAENLFDIEEIRFRYIHVTTK